MKKMKKPVAILIAALILVTSMMSCLTASAVFVGDVNHDGQVTAGDARIVLRAAAKLESLNEKDSHIADANHDGQVTASDARIILRAAAKLESPESISEDSSYDWQEETTTKTAVAPTTSAPITKPIVTTTTDPTTKPSAQTNDYDRLVQYLKTNGTYKDGDYFVLESYDHDGTQFFVKINYDVQKSQIIFFVQGFFDDGTTSSLGLFCDKNSDSQTVALLYTMPSGAECFGRGYIYKQSYSETNDNIYWTSLDCPSHAADEFKELGVAMLNFLFTSSNIILESTGTGVTMNSLGFTAYGKTSAPAEEQTTNPPAEPTTTAPTTKPAVQTSDYDRLVQYLKTNGTYKDGDYTLKMSYRHDSTQIVAMISYDAQKSQIVFYSHAFYDSGAASSVGLFFNKNSDSQTVAVLYTTARGAECFAGGNIYKQSYSDRNNGIYWSYLDCPSNATDSLKSIGVSQLSLLFIDASMMLDATGTGITMHSLGFTAY